MNTPPADSAAIPGATSTASASGGGFPWWSAFFGVVLFATFAIWIVAPGMGWWLPSNVASFGGEVDFLFYVILGFTGFFFVLTEVILVYAMAKYRHRRDHKSDYTHGNNKLEIFWTVVPAGILLFIAFAQIRAWENIKYQSRMPPPDQILHVTARQWEWRLRYPYDSTRFSYDADTDATLIQVAQRNARNWAEYPESDDIHVANELHTWMGANVKMYLKTNDVLHSFYLPNLRLKQDALPGKTIPMWFKATEANTKFLPETGDCERSEDHNKRWEIACAELCGGRHYAMRGKLFVHPNQEDFQQWLSHKMKQQRSRQPEATGP
jgi:cytochrome c oxidase subunit 2